MNTTPEIRDAFKHFLNRWRSHFESTCMDNSDIVNDFMWSYGCAGVEIYNELLDILENNQAKNDKQV